MDGLRITDAERDEAVAALGEHYAVGRLTKQEYDERAELAWQAKTRGELVPLFADLPGAETQRPVAPSRQWQHHGRAHGRFPVMPFLPIIIGLVVLTALTHEPFILFALVAWAVLGRRRWHHRVLHQR